MRNFQSAALQPKSAHRVSRTRSMRSRVCGLEPLESRDLLATDLLAEIEIREGTTFRPRAIVGYDGNILLRGNDGFTGPEPWIIAGNDPSSTALLRDISGGVLGSGPRDFIEFDGKLYFAANNSFNGYELWVTQGTSGTTRLIADLWPGSESGVPTDLVIFQDQLYFFANDGESGRELYRSDGTAIGTDRVGDLVPGLPGVAGEHLTVVGDQMFFVSTSSVPGQDGLWVSDGTEEGTGQLAIPGVDNQSIEEPTPIGDLLLFASANHLWVSDGTIAGTTPIEPSGDPLGSTFSDVDVADDGSIYVTTERGLQRISADLTSSTTISPLADGANISEGRVYYWNSTGVYGVERNLSSTQLLGFVPFLMSRMGSTFNVPGGMIFNINLSVDRWEIWATNGTREGTVKIEDVQDRSDEPLATFEQIGESIYFSATNGAIRESLWSIPAPTIVPPPQEPGIPGDLTGDDLVNAADIDAIYAALRLVSSDETFDLNEDGEVNDEDVDFLIEDILDTKRGDANLNGTIDIGDFLALSRNFGQSDAGWTGGDFDGDGTVGVSDFLALSLNFGFDRDDE